MNPDEFKQKTKALALGVIKLTGSIPGTKAGGVIARQLLRSGTSVAANYRAACCAESRADFVAKLGIVQEECDESLYWIELLTETRLVKSAVTDEVRMQAKEILALVISSIRTAKARK